MSILIPRNTTIPTSITKKCCTIHDYQTSCRFPVYEGERSRSTDNNLLGEITLHGLPPALRGDIELTVTFNLDANGLLHVSAECEVAGVKTSATITNDKGRLAKNEIEMMIRDAEIYIAEDEEFKKNIKAMNVFEDYAYNMRSAIRAKSNLDAYTQEKVENAIKEAIQWVNANRSAEANEYNSKKRDLKAIFNSIIPGIC